ncbi:MAG: hypothetical protein HW421_2618 [Ignavibacteria bacterium]|nr:hypothetical protein [Ignavibacteria bacterium]
MKIFSFYLSFALISIIFISCQLPTGPAGKDGVSDKQIRFDFDFNGGGYLLPHRSIDDTIEHCQIIRFNIANYVGVDSVIFVACISCYDSTKYFAASIINLTDNVEIQNSVLKTNSYNPIVLSSTNLFHSFPKKEIDLVVRISKKDTSDFDGLIEKAYLFLYRK